MKINEWPSSRIHTKLLETDTHTVTATWSFLLSLNPDNWLYCVFFIMWFKITLQAMTIVESPSTKQSEQTRTEFAKYWSTDTSILLQNQHHLPFA